MPDLMTMWPIVMACRLTLFAEMLLDRLCNFRVCILTQNKVLIFLRSISPMGRDIFIRRRFLNTALFMSNLLFPRHVKFQQITIRSNMTNLPTIMTSMNKLTLCS
jgi:hypothetical protein